MRGPGGGRVGDKVLARPERGAEAKRGAREELGWIPLGDLMEKPVFVALRQRVGGAK